MKITATDIDAWADTRAAQELLPLLIRRLAGRVGDHQTLAIPGGDSVSRPGWDGVCDTPVGNAWVPQGVSRWEMGCNQKPVTKANKDYETRSAACSDSCETFVFVTPRRWHGKARWAEQKRADNVWRDVRVIDADDLEAWIEHEPSIGLWFAEQLGLSGDGIESVTCYWQRWSHQSQPPISVLALSKGRDAAVEQLKTQIQDSPSVIVIQADSREEASAFACAQLVDSQLADRAACITSPNGWRFVEANSNISLVIGPTADAAAAASPRQGRTLIVPACNGDKVPTRGVSLAQASSSPIALPRVLAHEFEAALVDLGEEQSDASRIARSCGRSWSVYRRYRSNIPSLRQPAWAAARETGSLTSLCLLGCWDGNRAGDRLCVEEIAGETYEEVERHLLALTQVDDAPVIRVGTVWKAKAPVELMYVLGPTLDRARLGRFFAVARAVLSAPDPALELDAEKRWMASVYRKVRDESGLAIESIVDSLAKLAMYAEHHNTSESHWLINQIDDLVRMLLHDADKARWLSLSDLLKPLAEAAPDTFLAAVENSLLIPESAVRQLFREGGDGFTSRWYHTGLLWALETLAWNARRLARVSAVLARLSEEPLPRNLGNSPLNSLAEIFLPWRPHTTASLERRLEVIDYLIRQHEEQAWSLVLRLLSDAVGGLSRATATPDWREDNAGALAPLLRAEVHKAYGEIADRAVRMAADYPERIAALLAAVRGLGPSHQKDLLGLIRSAVHFDDVGRAIVRSQVRDYLHWQNSFNEAGDCESRVLADALAPEFDRLAPDDLPVRHAWLFETPWVELPEGDQGDMDSRDRKLAERRSAALAEIYKHHGWEGFSRLVVTSGDPRTVAESVAREFGADPQFLNWVDREWTATGRNFHDPLLSGALSSLDDRARSTGLGLMAERRAETGVDAAAALFSCAPFQTATWDQVESYGSEIAESYWSSVKPWHAGDDCRDTAVDRLLRAGRPRTAFSLARFSLRKARPAVVFKMLSEIRAGAEPQGPLPDAHWVREAISVIAECPEFTRRQIAYLEFAFHDALGVGRPKRSGALVAEMLAVPAFFMECVCLAFRPKHGDAEPIDDGMRAAASTCWSILHNGRGVPGEADGAVDDAKLNEWITAVREIANQRDRSEIVESILGQWVSDCPADDDGTWPCSAVRNLLEQDRAEKMRSTFGMGVHNNRGVTSRAYFDGGKQERALAQDFQTKADRISATHPRVAAMLHGIAESYRREAAAHDDEAQISMELRS